MVGLPRIELGTSSLSGMRSNQLSYSPAEHLSYRVAKPIGDRPAHNRGLRHRLEFPSETVGPLDHFFLKHGDTHTAHQLGDQVEHHRANGPQPRAEHR